MEIQRITDIPNLKRDVPLAPFTTWKIGGPARYFWEPEYHLLPDVIRLCYQQNIPHFYLGHGSNVLINDKGFNGLVICTRNTLQDISYDNHIIEAHSGVSLPRLAHFASKLEIGGYEFLTGIPGTIGGGVVINAGITSLEKREISDILIEVEVLLPDGTIEWRRSEMLNFGYRRSNLLDTGIFVTKARFKYTWKSSKEEIHFKTTELIKKRRQKQPWDKRTAGSIFKQPKEGKAAGWYIEQAGLKGYQIGDAKISDKHANWIENLDNASSEDVKQLIKNISDCVLDKFGIELIREVGYIDD